MDTKTSAQLAGRTKGMRGEKRIRRKEKSEAIRE
jgi:hypothetical protein